MNRHIRDVTSKFFSIISVFFFVFTYIQFGVSIFSQESFPTSGSKLYWYIIFITAPLLGLLIFHLGTDSVEKILSGRVVFLVLAGLTVIPRVVWLDMVNVLPRADFKTYHMVASAMAEGKMVLNDYISLFPHVIGYPFILSFFYRIFGSHVLVAQILNIFLGCGIVFLIYKLGTSISGRLYGFAAAVIWSVWPSQIFYVSLVSTEAAYTFLVLLYAYIFLKVVNIEKNVGLSLTLFFMLGVLCAVCNAIRPFGLLLLIATAIYYFVFTSEKVVILRKGIARPLLYLTLAASYFLTSTFISHSVSDAVDRDIARKPMGFTTYVGANLESRGTWNPEDSNTLVQLLKDKNNTAQGIHDILLRKAFDRVIGRGIGNIKLFYRKHGSIWLEDTDALKYIRAALDVDNPSAFDFTKYFNMLSKVSNLYYYMMLFLCFAGCIMMLKRGAAYPLLFPIIILWGVIGLHIIVEVAGRYHYPAIPIFSLIAAAGLKKDAKIGFINEGTS